MISPSSEEKSTSHSRRKNRQLKKSQTPSKKKATKIEWGKKTEGRISVLFLFIFRIKIEKDENFMKRLFW